MAQKLPQGRLSRTEEEALLDELLTSLDEMVDKSGCLDMLPLWFIATKKQRKEFIQQHSGEVTGVPRAIRQWKAPKRSKYAALAAWRQVVLWRDALSELPAKLRRAVEDTYYTPYKENDPPYAWTKASSEAPSVHRYSSPSELDLYTKRGCARIVRALEELAAGSGSMSVDGEARAAFTEVGARKTVIDVLRIKRFK